MTGPRLRRCDGRARGGATRPERARRAGGDGTKQRRTRDGLQDLIRRSRRRVELLLSLESFLLLHILDVQRIAQQRRDPRQLIQFCQIKLALVDFLISRLTLARLVHRREDQHLSSVGLDVLHQFDESFPTNDIWRPKSPSISPCPTEHGARRRTGRSRRK